MATPTFSLAAFTTAQAAIGRGVLMYAPYWDGTTDLVLTQASEIEGDAVLTPNESKSTLTTPGPSGAAIRRVRIEGAAPKLVCSLYIGNPALRAALSPTGSASMGHSRGFESDYLTLAVFPLELLYDYTTKLYKSLTYTGAGWRLNGQVLTTEQERLLGNVSWIWKASPTRPPITYKQDDGGRAVESFEFDVIMDDTKPEGEQLVTYGDPADAGIDIAPIAS